MRLFAEDTLVYLTIKSHASAQILQEDLHYSVAKERFGLEETRVPRDPPNRTEGKPE